MPQITGGNVPLRPEFHLLAGFIVRDGDGELGGGLHRRRRAAAVIVGPAWRIYAAVLHADPQQREDLTLLEDVAMFPGDWWAHKDSNLGPAD